jgi:NAD+ synthase
MKLQNKIIKWIQDYAESNNINSLVIGISGGIDSALTSILCAETGIQTILVSMPIMQSNDELIRARNHIRFLEDRYKNVHGMEKDLTKLFETFQLTFSDLFTSDLAFANARSRLRMTSLYHIAQTSNGIVVGTGNRIEDFGVGFFTKYGDGGVDISPIADLMKSEVKSLAKEIGIAEDIINAAPTDGLWEDGRTDEDQIGATYEELEWAMTYEEGYSLTNRQQEVLDIYNKFNKQNKHKMIPIPIFKQ